MFIDNKSLYVAEFPPVDKKKTLRLGAKQPALLIPAVADFIRLQFSADQ